MRRLSPKTLEIVQKANIAAAAAPVVAPTVAPTIPDYRSGAPSQRAGRTTSLQQAEATSQQLRDLEFYGGILPEQRLTVVAEVGDTFGSLAQKSRVEEIDFIQANKDVTEIKADAVYNVPQANIMDFRKAEAEAVARDLEAPPPAQQSQVDRWLGLEQAETRDKLPPQAEYAPAPGPQVGFDFQLEGSQSDLYKALAEQTKAIYNVEPALRMDKFGSELLGLHLYEDQGLMDTIDEAGFEPWVKPFVVNYLNQFPGTNVSVDANGEITGQIDWSYIDDQTIQRLDDLGFIDTGQAPSGVGAGEISRGATASGTSGGYGYPIGYGYPPRPAYETYGTKSTYLGLTSWSI